ncbi:MAG: NAD-dependent epimerase/dehydratase family protein [Planctomycetes bacterium]|nr:NAD-dependent epimerase/dehydratase family protein [Planctomycetota bacterium]
MKLFVTGSNGFIGSNLVRRLLADGHEVSGLVRPDSDLSFVEGVEYRRVAGDLADLAALRAGAAGAEVVFHVAALASDWGSYRTFYRTNVEGTAHVLAVARDCGVRRVVHVSSTVVHGFTGFFDRSEDDPQPPSRYPYVETKRLAEGLLFAAEGVEVTAIRPGNVFGPRDRVTSLPLLTALRKGAMGVLDGGRRFTCPTYVENLIDALVLAAVVPGAAGRAYLVTDGLAITWREFTDALADAIGVPRPKLSLPVPIARLAAAAMEGVWAGMGALKPPPLTRYRVANGGTDYHFSVKRARAELGWAPRVGLSEAVRRTAEWFLALRPGRA